ncbi:MAG: ATP-dependent helicase [Thaumarchaeota archaeon]|nr:ATP-dependent helicase [Nitrososphaerota archaeon]
MRSNATVTLIEEQETAINAKDGVWVVLAGPGSGKTTVLVRRYVKMMMSGIPTKDMLNLTFTHSAAQEMAERVGLLDAKSVFRTFHSFALDMLKQERDKLSFATCDTIIPVELQDYQLMFDLVKIYPAINWRTLQEKITIWKCANVQPDRAIDESQSNGIEYFYAHAYRDYEIKCRQQGWLDFSSLMEETVKLLETNEEVRSRYKRKYIAVDEAQDCDELQFKLLQLIFDGNIFAVGDENQLIYEWRNAKSGNLTNFAQVFPGAKILFLGTNHRSTGSLVQFLREILPVDNGLASYMRTYNDDGPPFTITRYADEQEEAEQILKKITDPLNSVVIARTNRQLFVFQRLCAMKGIKYNFLGKKDFWEQNEVKKLLSLAKAYPSSGLASSVLTHLIQENNLIHLYSQAGSNPMESSPVENLNSIVKISAGKGNMKEFLDYLRKLTHARKSAKALTLSTVHQSKGREYDYVYFVGVKQGTMPHDNGEPAEEARIFFVGASRAAKELHISFYKSLSMYLINYQDRIMEFQNEEKEERI